MTARSFLAPDWPGVAVEIAPRRVTAVAMTRRGDRFTVTGYGTAALDPGIVVPTLTASNVTNPSLLAEAVRRALQGAGGRVRRVGLVIPDSAAKVSFLRFEKVPERAADLDQLVRWQIRKAAPFRIEDAQLGVTPGAPLADGGREFVATVARRDVIEEYERACAAAGAHAGVVDLSTFNLINFDLASARAGGAANDSTDWMLVHVTPEYTTLTIVKAGHLVFFRNLRDEAEGTLADSVHQTAMYYEDRLGGAGFSRVMLAGGGTAAETRPGGAGASVRDTLERRLGQRVMPLDVRALGTLTLRTPPSVDVLDALAPPVGLLVREAA